MPRYEYKVVPAPQKGLKRKGVRGAEARFSLALQELMNGLSGYGWEYQRAETLPSVERSGLTGSTTEWRNVLVFRRLRADEDAEALPQPQPNTSEQPDSVPLHDKRVGNTGAATTVSSSPSILARVRKQLKRAPKKPEHPDKSDDQISR